ncbi:MAG: AzlC family ABC transporter permease [Ruminococcus sp.]|nr:AzlC family ABC transporter permease [Ruminococcus sp.]
MKKKEFLKGLYHGIPIGLGYLSISFGFGIMAIRAGISVLAAAGISFTTFTSAGQAAGVGVIAAGGTLLEMLLTQIIINLRYSLMGISLSQKLAPEYSTVKRLIGAHGITDEIFAVAISQKEPITPAYMYGLALLPLLGWTCGTLLGGVFGQILPESVSNALGMMLYAMFLAIIIPPAKKEKSVLLCVVIAAAISVVFKYAIPSVGGGFSVIISAVIAAAICAAAFPVSQKETEVEA